MSLDYVCQKEFLSHLFSMFLISTIAFTLPCVVFYCGIRHCHTDCGLKQAPFTISQPLQARSLGLVSPRILRGCSQGSARRGAHLRLRSLQVHMAFVRTHFLTTTELASLRPVGGTLQEGHSPLLEVFI